MKTAFMAAIAALVMAAGTARAQEPKAHEHEHNQPPAVAEQKADEKAEHGAMDCMGMMKDMQAKMKDMQVRMKDMQDRMSGIKTEKK